ncbi:hypothetical protein MUO93_10730 [Candidatus Bathyarchaeota archaeon]|nr:hypothetical protein [Candidatus Bathyarchaeota archaeon]
MRGCIAKIKAISTLDRVEMLVLASLGRRESGYAVYSDGCRYRGCCALHCPSRAIKVIFPLPDPMTLGSAWGTNTKPLNLRKRRTIEEKAQPRCLGGRRTPHASIIPDVHA